MSATKFLLIGLMALFSIFTANSRAEDIDIYAQTASTTGTPNVLFVIDNAANFSSSGANCTYTDGTNPSLNGTVGGIEQCALVNVLSALPLNSDGSARINVGLMAYNANNIRDVSGTNCGGSGAVGACLVQPLVAMSGSTQTGLLNYIKSWTTSGGAGSGYIKATNEATAASMQESWAYYAGKTGLSGRNYSGIQPGAGCQKNYVIFIGNSFSSAGTPGDGDAVATALANAPGVTAAQKTLITKTYTTVCTGKGTTFTFPSNATTHENKGFYADEWAGYMSGTDIYGTFDGVQNIITYAVGIVDPTSCQPEYAATLNSMADSGTGRYFATTDYSSLVIAIGKVLNEIQATNSVFASSTLPVSVNAQGTYLNQIYMGMFRPDQYGSPRWLGNLKQYQFLFDNTTQKLILGDNSKPKALAALSTTNSGFISPLAVSFWTSLDTSVLPDKSPPGGFYINDPASLLRVPVNYFDSPDGELVERGGVGQQLRLANLTSTYPNPPTTTSPDSPRKVYTYCPSGASCNTDLTNSANAFVATNSALTGTVLGLTTPVAITSITRSGTNALVTTAAAHNVSVGTSIQISGVTITGYPGANDYDSTYTVIAAPTPLISGQASDSTHFYITVPEYPVTPATGSFTASTPSGSIVDVTSLTRAAGAPDSLVTVIANNTFTVGQTVTISGASAPEFNTSVTVTQANSTQFQFVLSNTSPTYHGGGGNVYKSGTTCTTSNPGLNCYTLKADVAATPLTSGILRSGTNVMMTASSNIDSSWAAGTVVLISGASPTAYNNTSTGYTLTGVGTACSITTQTWNGTTFVSTTTTGTNKRSFCFSIPATSVSPQIGVESAVIGTTKASSGSTVSVCLTRSGNTVTANSYASGVTCTPTPSGTLTAHGFTAGSTVNIGGVPGTNESGYIGSFTVATVPSTTQLTYTVTTTPANGTGGTLSAGSAISTNTLINWVRGQDNAGGEYSPGSGITVRPSIHGDVLHSRPIVINYGGTTGVVAFYGSNDGVFRAINANQTAAIGSTLAGGELWGFIPTEHFSKLVRQRSQSPLVILPTTPGASTNKDYFVDGSTGLYQVINSSGVTTKAYIYLSMRRGGRFIYALDVTNPASPQLLWKKKNTDTDFTELGQTWSEPKVAFVTGHTNPVLIFGAGYDPNEDNEPSYTTADTMGRGIFILDAIDGSMVWSARKSCTGVTPPCATTTGMDYAIPADMTLVDRDNDGKIDGVYATDLGGNVWRVDLEPSTGTSPANWAVRKLAELGCDSGVCTTSQPRKFFYPVDVVPTNSFVAILVGSGDREHPLRTQLANSVINKFYLLMDPATGKDGSTITTPITQSATAPSGLFDATDTSLTYDSTTKSCPTSIAWDGSRQGYFIKLQGLYVDTSGASPVCKTSAGEKTVNAAATAAGNTFFGTNTPAIVSPTSCTSDLGIAKGYTLSALTGTSKFVVFDGGGLPPTPVYGFVTIAVTNADGTTSNKLIPFVIGGGNVDPTCVGPDCKSEIGGQQPPINVSTSRKRTHWYIERDQ